MLGARGFIHCVIPSYPLFNGTHDIFWLSIQNLLTSSSGIHLHYSLLYEHFKFRIGAQLGPGNDSCVTVLVHVNVSYLL